MSYEYSKKELSGFTDSILDKIRVKYELDKQNRDKLINSILAHQEKLEANEKKQKARKVNTKLISRKTSKDISSKDISYFDNLPRDALAYILLKLNYDEIAKRCKLSKKINSLCNDERFWRQYAENRNLKKDRESDTYLKRTRA